MKNIITTPKESKEKIIRPEQQDKLSFELVKINQPNFSRQSTLKTTPSTPYNDNKYSNKFKFKIPKINNRINNDYELEQKNKYYFKKLFEIKNHNNMKKYNSKCILNSHRKDGYVKLGIMNLAQQNLYMLKRLYEQKSEYSVKKMEKDYQKVQRIKKVMCKFPEIKFNKTKDTSNETKFLKSDKSDRSNFLPTINYINEGSMIKIKKRLLQNMKKNDTSLKLISPRNLKKDFIKINTNINKENGKEEFEFEFNKKNKNFLTERINKK